ncbi:DUF6941 family protein [Staphylococcus warneri]|uniref:DUF6941 family protein n=1 Tax=Staphylococcus warneri TaxID=1292 RepID=UPI0007350C41|nr:hypothetical protein [Staphylococcus warneri]MCE5011344.1 hypothetical protein [Staphylococcus warneri]MDC6376632.1 hypothetical protein [Staphylococcus warneri]PNN19149.1 hypothetical protein AL513_012350 [Staphylococcus warneri]PNN19209.1 hypothetical protein AL513_012690 [Staphylococcus warneri]RAV25165.1 hypothetical protein DQE84_11200 [Staphylococcus warneri]
MAKVAWIAPVTRALNNEYGDLVLDTPLTQLALEAFPNNYSFSIAFGIIDLDPNIQNKINLRIGLEQDNTTEVIFNVDIQMENNLDREYQEFLSNKKVEYESNINLSNFRFEKPGLYYIELSIDNNSTKINFKVTNKGV